jgi:dihydrofolate synthase/folylpolyglutamate synthase
LKRTVSALEELQYDALHLVLGVVGDKELEPVWKWLPARAHLHFCAANIPRALPVEELTAAAAKAGRVGKPYETVARAVLGAQSQAAPSDLIVVLGSIFVAAEALRTFD